jgi:hypothetical protein
MDEINHLAEEELLSVVFDGAALSTDAARHLAGCPACRQAHAAVQLLAGEFLIARRSAPSPAALQRYASLFDAVQRQPTPLQQMWRTVRATLAWDSRQQPALQGVRSGVAASYRLLYTAPSAEIELLVEPSQGGHRLDGEVAAEDAAAMPALVQMAGGDGALLYETETTDTGRFRLAAVAPGAYTLTVTFAAGDALTVPALEIT